MKGTSAELQEISLVTFINDPYMFSKCKNEMNESFYETLSYKLIFKSLCIYYDKYLIIPNSSDIKIIIKENYTEDYGEVDDILMTVDKLYSQKVTSVEFSESMTIEFIRRCLTERTLGDVVRSLKGTGEISLQDALDKFREVSSLTISRNDGFNLGDVDKIPEIRKRALGDAEHPLVVKFFIDYVNKSFQYGGITAGTLNMIVAPPGRGKTTLLINQGVYSALQGLKVCHIFLGDMKAFDGMLRYVSCYTQRYDESNQRWVGLTSKDLAGLSSEELKKVVQKYNMTGIFSNVDIYEYAADELSANQLIEEIKSHQNRRKVHYDLIIIDYDENLKEEEESMYKSGGQIYNKIAFFASQNNSVVFIASQPRKEFWEKDIIPMEAASESSKKQKIIDLMLTIGRPKGSKAGTLFIAKNRRGTDGGWCRLLLDGDSGKIISITEADYNMIKQSERTANANGGNQSQQGSQLDPNMFK